MLTRCQRIVKRKEAKMFEQKGFFVCLGVMHAFFKTGIEVGHATPLDPPPANSFVFTNFFSLSL